MTVLPVLPTALIDRWSVPGWYARLLADVSRHPDLYGPEDLEEALRDAVRLATQDQLRAGLDLITDGQPQRPGTVSMVHEAIKGVIPATPARRWGAPAGGPGYLCVEPISAPSGLGLTQEYLRLRGLTEAPLKVPVPGPWALAEGLDGGEIYPSRDATADALAPVLNRELKHLVRVGATFLQLTEPATACAPEHPERFARLIEQTVAGVGATVSLHVGFAGLTGVAIARRSYRPIFPHLSRLPVQQIALELAWQDMAEVELLRQIKPPMSVAVGVVDVGSQWVEPPELIADRLRAALAVVEPERLHAVPDAGFGRLPRAVAVAKAVNLVAAARLVRAELKTAE